MQMIGRFIQLLIGLLFCGLAIAAMVRANLGLGPWDVLHQGIAHRTGMSLGAAVIATSAAVMALWLPLRQRPGIGTLVNIVMIGLFANVGLLLLPDVSNLFARIAMLVLGIVGTGVGASIYLGADLGPGARDGLMTGVVQRYGWPVHGVKTCIELSALVIGWLSGGTVGIGTIAFALLTGPVVHATLSWCDHRRWRRDVLGEVCTDSWISNPAPAPDKDDMRDMRDMRGRA